MSLFKLPRELRSMIYAHATTPTASLSDYKGLYLSCKQTKQEYTKERIFRFEQYLQWLQQSLQRLPLQIFGSTDTAGRCELRLSVPTTAVASYDMLPFRSPAPPIMFVLEHFSDVHVDSITIGFHEAGNVPYSFCNTARIHKYVVNVLLSQLNSIRARRVVIENPRQEEWPHRLSYFILRQIQLSRYWKPPEWVLDEQRSQMVWKSNSSSSKRGKPSSD
jgi:hypothetical protein